MIHNRYNAGTDGVRLCSMWRRISPSQEVQSEAHARDDDADKAVEYCAEDETVPNRTTGQRGLPVCVVTERPLP